MGLSIHVQKKLGEFNLKVDLETGDEIIGLLGYSGCGKTMTLKMIAGIITPDRGRIVLNDKVLYDSEKKINLKPQQRNVGLMFQSYALFNHMSVYENIAIGMKEKAEEKKKIIDYYLELLNLTHLKDQKPKTLSGGQKQRVALARILAQQPDVLMLDEPFSALDNHLIYTIEREFKKALKCFKGPVIYISHNRHEIYKYCQKTAVMSEGQLVEFKQTKELFDECETIAAARLTGCRNIAKVYYQGEYFNIPDWELKFKIPASKRAFNYIGVRESDLVLARNIKDSDCIHVTVEEVTMMPDKVKMILQTAAGYRFTYTCSKREYEEMGTLLEERELNLGINPNKFLYLK